MDRSGKLKPGSVQASQLTFEKKSEHMGEYSTFNTCIHTCVMCDETVMIVALVIKLCLAFVEVLWLV